MLGRVINWLLPADRWAKLRRIGQLIGAACLLLIATVLLVVGTGTGRESLLKFALSRAVAVLPGELTALPQWPRLGHIELHDVIWTTETDTLARAERLVFDVSLGDLVRHRDLHLREVIIAGLWADLDAITAALPPDTSAADAAGDTATSSAESFSVPYLADGALDGLPSAALESLTITDLTLLLPGGRPLRVLDVNGHAELRQGRSAELTMALRAMPLPDLGVSWRFHGRVTDGLHIATAPIVLTAGQDDNLPEAIGLPLTGEIEVPLATLTSLTTDPPLIPAVRIAGLEITGALGAYTLSADSRDSRRCRFAVQGTWAEPPAYLTHVTDAAGTPNQAAVTTTSADIWSEKLMLLHEHWPDDMELGFAIDGELTASSDSTCVRLEHARLRGDFRLPGPAELASLLPSQTQLTDLSGLDATLAVDVTFAPTDTTYQLRLDLGATPWLQPGLVALRGDLSTLHVDTLAIGFEGAALTVGGTVARDSIDIDVALIVPDAAALALRAGVDAAIAGRLELTAAVRGSLPLPDGEIDLAVAGQYRDIALPDLTAHLEHDHGKVVAMIQAPTGAQMQQIQLDSLSLGFVGTLADSLTGADGELRFAAAGPELSALLRAEVRAKATGTSTLRVDSLSFAHRQGTLTNRSPFVLQVDPAAPSLRLTDLALGGPIGHIAGGGVVSPDTLDFAIDLELGFDLSGLEDLMPPELPVEADSIAVAGSCRLVGSLAAPAGTLELSAALLTDQKIADLGLQAHGWLLSAGGSPPPLAPGVDPPTAPPPFAPRHGIAAELRLTNADTVLAIGRLALPGTIALQPAAVAVDPRQGLEASLTIPGIDLATLKPILPAGTGLTGRLRCDATATGKGDRIELAGNIGAEDVYVTLEDGSWLAATGTASISGTVSEPKIAGDIEVTGGLIRLPETPPSLLPVEGESLLWLAEARADSLTRTAAADSLPPEAPPAATSLLPVIDVALRCPGDLWLRGRNLNVEMAGDLNLELHEGVTGLGGSLRAVRGDLQILGRTLKITKGDINFFPDEQTINPQLDLRLEAHIDNILYKIAILGRAEKPEMVFSSDPPMSEGDVVSGLLFGKPLSDLDSGQANLVADRSKEIAIAYGAAVLTQGMARQIGVDMITIKAASSSDETSSLVVGKYLSPKVMVQYETPLEQRATSIVRLEYSINRYFKVDTSVSQGEDSGIDLKWVLDY